MSQDAAICLISDDDLPLELQLQKDPNNKEIWRNYILQWKRLNKPIDNIIWLYERFMLQIPTFLEIWQEYIFWLHSINSDGTYSEFILSVYQRCHELLKKFDSDIMYLEYLTVALKSYQLTHIRLSFNLCLKNLKILDNQNRIWEMIIPFISDTLIPLTENSVEESDDELNKLDQLKLIIYETFFHTNTKDEEKNDDTYSMSQFESDIWSSQLLEKYLVVCPIESQNNILLLLFKTNDSSRIKKNFDKYLIKNKNLVDNIPFSLYSIYLKTLQNIKGQLKEYNDLYFKLRTKYPEKIVQLIILHCQWLIKQKKINEFEECLTNELNTVLDVSQFIELFNYYLDFKQAYIDTILNERTNFKTENEKAHWDKVLSEQIDSLNELTETRELKINDLKLRNNINNVSTWLERVSLFENIDDKCQVYNEALIKINPLMIPIRHEKLSTLWCSYIDIYWDLQKFDTARELYETAIKVPFPHIIDLEDIYLHWANNELNQFGLERSIDLLSKILQIPDNFEILITQFEDDIKANSHNVPVNLIVFNSLKLWTEYIDQLEAQSMNISKIEKTVKAYENLIKIKLVTPKIFLNYANYLKKFGQFTKSYQIYQRAITQYSNLEIKYLIWLQYLNDVIKFRVTTKLTAEQVRDLFDESIETFTGQEMIDYSQICSMYNLFEEPQNMVNSRSIKILTTGAENLSNKFMTSKITLWRMAIDKTKKIFPDLECRPLYQKVIETAPAEISIDYCIEFATMECTYHEYQRTREILRHGSQLLPPIRNKKLWNYWEQFEIEHGNKVSYKDMLLFKKKLEDEMVVDTETVSKQDGNIAFVASSGNKLLKKNELKNENEIDLDL